MLSENIKVSEVSDILRKQLEGTVWLFLFVKIVAEKNWMGAVESYPCGNSHVDLFSSVHGSFL